MTTRLLLHYHRDKWKSEKLTKSECGNSGKEYWRIDGKQCCTKEHSAE